MWYRIAMQTRRFIEGAITDLKGRLKRRVIGESTKVGYDRQNRLYAGNGDEIQAEQLKLLTTDKSVLHATYQITRTKLFRDWVRLSDALRQIPQSGQAC